MTNRDIFWMVVAIPMMLLNQWLDENGFREYIWTPIAVAIVTSLIALIRRRFAPRNFWAMPLVMVGLGLFIFLLD